MSCCHNLSHAPSPNHQLSLAKRAGPGSIMGESTAAGLLGGLCTLTAVNNAANYPAPAGLFWGCNYLAAVIEPPEHDLETRITVCAVVKCTSEKSTLIIRWNNVYPYKKTNFGLRVGSRREPFAFQHTEFLGYLLCEKKGLKKQRSTTDEYRCTNVAGGEWR